MMPTAPTNRILWSFSPRSRALLFKHATPVELPLHAVLCEEHSVPKYAYFLLTGLASTIAVMPNGESAEVGCVGREGVVGGSHLLGAASLPTRCVMQLGGSGIRIPLTHLRLCFQDSAEVRSGMLEFEQQQSAVFAQTAACNRLHGAEQRLVRWLLTAHDRTGYNTLEFTQEYLAEMLSTQRTTVTLTAGNLQRRGLIRYSRGKIQLLDHAGLEAAACVCNSIIRELFRGLYSERSTVAMIQANGTHSH